MCFDATGLNRSAAVCARACGIVGTCSCGASELGLLGVASLTCRPRKEGTQIEPLSSDP